MLITISRYIERLALEQDGGKHRASFQYLSRINDEQGTKTVYERLANSSTNVHIYGIPDWNPPSEVNFTIHSGRNTDFRNVWFVMHIPDDKSLRYAALVAIQQEPGTWDGVWTYDENRVRAINHYIERNL
ncbi:DICT sensory domain-containing protein [Natrinema sp. DC36]|uniref:DICT sensory domain-containing protein n=1 Tax=Natrinema sp. DC36 TaxID=2878680 RepID=UPI0031F30A88